MTSLVSHIRVNELIIGNDLPLSIIAGPCQMEGRGHALDMAGALADISQELGIGLIYKTSFDKANRTCIDSPRGIGLEQANKCSLKFVNLPDCQR